MTRGTGRGVHYVFPLLFQQRMLRVCSRYKWSNGEPSRGCMICGERALSSWLRRFNRKSVIQQSAQTTGSRMRSVRESCERLVGPLLWAVLLYLEVGPEISQPQTTEGSRDIRLCTMSPIWYEEPPNQGVCYRALLNPITHE